MWILRDGLSVVFEAMEMKLNGSFGFCNSSAAGAPEISPTLMAVSMRLAAAAEFTNLPSTIHSTVAEPSRVSACPSTALSPTLCSTSLSSTTARPTTARSTAARPTTARPTANRSTTARSTAARPTTTTGGSTTTTTTCPGTGTGTTSIRNWNGRVTAKSGGMLHWFIAYNINNGGLLASSVGRNLGIVHAGQGLVKPAFVDGSYCALGQYGALMPSAFAATLTTTTSFASAMSAAATSSFASAMPTATTSSFASAMSTAAAAFASSVAATAMSTTSIFRLDFILCIFTRDEKQ
ncbi:lipid-transfer protein [Striga asiatica]|uniref:Lipid-transfer protein n=1 Tax=Striga asiatica TaxID=4170 RepID=A0A5A7PNX0_STRAF|nr:lipid-transfer protein [Striga asiatica]